MKTVFSPRRKRLQCSVYVRVYEDMRSKKVGYCVHFSEEERVSYETFNSYRHRPLYRLNVRPKEQLTR